MHDNIKEQCLLNYGWEHCWCDPNFLKNFRIKEVVKGPFIKPKLVNNIPYVAVCQQDGSPISLSEGIPDCWTEYLTHYLKLFRYYGLMHKEDVDIVPQLRKNYRLYLGQGIPNPSVPYIDDLEIFSPENLENLKKHYYRSSHYKKFINNLGKEHCVCCSRKYLFKCPDSCDSDSCCSLKYCPRKYIPLVNCNRKCRNIKVLPNQILNKGSSKYKRRKPPKESSESCPSSPTESTCMADDEGENLKKNKSHNRRNKVPKEQQKKCSCPYIKNYCSKKTPLKNTRDNGEVKPPKYASKLIQVDAEPLTKTKSVQTDSSKLQCYTKCFWCNISQCNSPWKTSYKQSSPAGGCEVSYPTICAAPGFCFTGSCSHNPAFVCPYSFSNHFMNYKPHKEKSFGLKKQSKKKQLKERESEDDYNAEFKPNLMQLKANEASERSMKWYDMEQELGKQNYTAFKNNKNIYPYLTLAKPFDHVKYLTDEKLKYYLQRENFSSTTQNKFINYSPFSDFKSTNFDEGETSFYNPARVQLERVKSFSHSTPEHFKPLYIDKK